MFIANWPVFGEYYVFILEFLLQQKFFKIFTRETIDFVPILLEYWVYILLLTTQNVNFCEPCYQFVWWVNNQIKCRLSNLLFEIHSPAESLHLLQCQDFKQNLVYYMIRIAITNKVLPPLKDRIYKPKTFPIPPQDERLKTFRLYYWSVDNNYILFLNEIFY